MDSKIQMVVFDMAGTTVNEDNLVYKTLQKAVNEAGFDFSLQQVLEQGAGKEKKQAIRSILSVFGNTEDEVLIDEVFQNFMGQLKIAYDSAEILPQPNSTELFKALKEKNIFSVLNTGYDRTTAQSIVNKLGWAEGVDFDVLITASDVSNNRPNPAMILLAMQKLHIADASTVVKVGDSIIDIEEGQNAGCGLNIGITTGAHTAEQLLTAKPDKVIDDLIEILDLI